MKYGKKRRKKTDMTMLVRNIDVVNIAESVDLQELDKIGMRIMRGYDVDLNSRKDWEDKAKDGMKLAKLEKDEKTFPWAGAANIKYPLITTAAVQFAARAFPELIRDEKIVKASVIGGDPTGEKTLKAERVSTHMSYQLSHKMPEWVPNFDTLLHVLPIIGCYFKKTYFCPVKERNVSDAISPFDVVMHYKAKSLETARRISHDFQVYENDVWELQAAGIWMDRDIHLPNGEGGDESPAHDFIEQHCYLDLDDDGYDEPYIVTVHKDSSKVVRIVARYDKDGMYVEGGKLIRIKPIHHFTLYPFIPNPDGGIYAVGFGFLLLSLNESVNTVLNELLDAGALANAGGGFVSRGLNIDGGPMRFELGEWKQVQAGAQDLRGGIVPLPIREPSTVLMQLLGMLIEAAKEVSSVSNVMTGEEPAPGTPATTTLAMIEQGMKVFNGIYKRIYRSLSEEFKKLFRLNSKYLDDEVYFRLMDEQAQAGKNDYDVSALDVTPVADPALGTSAQKMARINALMAMSGRPGVNEDELTIRYFDAIEAHKIESLIIPPEQRPQPPPDPKLIEAQVKAEEAQVKAEESRLKLAERQAKLRLELEKMEAEINNLHAETTLALAKAEMEDPEKSISDYKDMIDELSGKVEEQEGMLTAVADQMRAEDAARADMEARNGVEQEGFTGMEIEPVNAGGGEDVGAGPGPVDAGAIAGADVGDVV